MEVKCVIVGDTDVGKTSLSLRFIHGHAPAAVSPTVGGSFLQKAMELRGERIVLQLWDTAGQERFRSMAPLYYRGARAAMLVFDVAREDSWRRVREWKEDVREHAEPGVALLAVGNKGDLDHAFEDADRRALQAELGCPVLVTSAFTGEGVDEAFIALAERARRQAAESAAEPAAPAVGLVPDASRGNERCCA